MRWKSKASIGDVAELARIGKLYEKVKGIKPHLVLVTGFVDPKAYEAAAKLGVGSRNKTPTTTNRSISSTTLKPIAV